MYDDDGRLQFAGAVGTGFDERLLNEITPQLRALQTDVCPFGEVPKLPGGAGRLRWVRPELVAQVAFHEWTEGGGIRAPCSSASATTRPPATSYAKARDTPRVASPSPTSPR